MVMSYLRLVTRDRVFKSILIVFAFVLAISGYMISNFSYMATPIVAFSQSDTYMANLNETSSASNEDVPTEKVRVGDIEIAYKMFGNGEPVLLVNGASAGIEGWDPSTLRSLSSNHTVIVFDGRGVGNTSMGAKPLSIQQLANDIAGLLDALKIQKASVLGYSLGGHVAQHFAIKYPDKVNGLILIATTCGGKDSIPKSPQVIKIQSEIVNKSINDIPNCL